MHPSVQWNNGNTGASGLESTADLCSKWPGNGGSYEPVDAEGECVLALDAALVLPWDTLRVCSVLSEAVSHPRITLKIILQEVKVLNLLFLGRNGRWAHFENFVSLFGKLIESLASIVIEARLAESIVIGCIELAWHEVRLLFFLNNATMESKL